jgi:hypothetical protein
MAAMFLSCDYNILLTDEKKKKPHRGFLRDIKGSILYTLSAQRRYFSLSSQMRRFSQPSTTTITALPLMAPHEIRQRLAAFV